MTAKLIAAGIRIHIGELKCEPLPAGYTCVGIQAHVSRGLVPHWSVWWVTDL
jgi:hypothetical protein